MDMEAAELACAAANPNACEPAGLLPSLVLVGTRKGGTTALSNLLRRHPRIVMPDCSHGQQQRPGVRGVCVWDKEVRYFSRGVQQRLGLCWYRGLYPCPRSGEGGGGSSGYVAFDGSPDYLVLGDEEVAAMRATLGARARLVAMLRNPADRFYSAYNMAMNEQQHREHDLRGRLRLPLSGLFGNNSSDGGVPYASFAAELDRLLACAPSCPHERSVVRMFFNFGLYARHLRKYIRHFGRASVLIERAEDFYADPAACAQRVLAFAGVAKATVEEGGGDGGAGGGRATSREPALSVTERNAGRLWGGGAYENALRPAERRKLQAFYAPHNRELYELVGRDMAWEMSGEAPAKAARSDDARETRTSFRHEL